MHPILSILLLASHSHAGVDDDILSHVRDVAHYKCTEVEKHDGYACTGDGNMWILIPKGLAQHAQTVMYFHGDVGPCPPGGSGENYLRGEMATLKRTNSIGVMPYRANSRDYSTSMGTYVSRADKAIGAAAPLVMAAHSYGGKFALRSLKADPSVMKRVKSFFFLDAQYDIDEIMFPVITELFTSQGAKPIHAVSVTTGDNTAALKKLMDANFPGKMTVSTGSGDHCHAPQYFSQL
jgi:hypothetical protein